MVDLMVLVVLMEMRDKMDWLHIEKQHLILLFQEHLGQVLHTLALIKHLLLMLIKFESNCYC